MKEIRNMQYDAIIAVVIVIMGQLLKRHIVHNVEPKWTRK